MKITNVNRIFLLGFCRVVVLDLGYVFNALSRRSHPIQWFSLTSGGFADAAGGGCEVSDFADFFVDIVES